MQATKPLHRLLIFALTLMLVAALLPAAYVAAYTATNNVSVTIAPISGVNSNGSGWTWNTIDANKLALTDVAVNVASGPAINLPVSTDVTGNNFVSISAGGTGIFCAGKLQTSGIIESISSSGDNAIRSNGNISIGGTIGTISSYADAILSSQSSGAMSVININGTIGSITCSRTGGETHAIGNNNGSININGEIGSITVNNGDNFGYGLWADGNITINGTAKIGSITASATGIYTKGGNEAVYINKGATIGKITGGLNGGIKAKKINISAPVEVSASGGVLVADTVNIAEGLDVMWSTSTDGSNLQTGIPANGWSRVKYVKIGESLSSATVTATGTHTYTGSGIEPDVTVTLDGTTLTEGTDYTVSYSNNVNAGTNTGKVTITGKGSYAGTKTGTFTIGKAPLTVKADDKTISFGALQPTYTYTVSGLLGSDTNSVVSGLTFALDNTFNSTQEGTFTITPSGGLAGNYTLSYETGTLTVTACTHEKTSEAITATCTKAGTKTVTCIVETGCKTVIGIVDVDQLGHDWDTGSVTTQPTSKTAGVKTFNCKRADCSDTKTESIPATGSGSTEGNDTESTIGTVLSPNTKSIPDLEPEQDAKNGGNGLIIFIVIAIIALCGAGCCIKIARPKKQATAMGDDKNDL